MANPGEVGHAAPLFRGEVISDNDPVIVICIPGHGSSKFSIRRLRCLRGNSGQEAGFSFAMGVLVPEGGLYLT